MSIILSRNSNPSIFLYGSGASRDFINFCDAARNNVSMVNVDFPDPDTPVTHVKVPRGIEALTFCKLLPDAPVSFNF